jgi:hypothetical protein
MKKFFFSAVTFLAVSLASGQNNQTINIMTLNGSWDIYDNFNGTIAKTSEQGMNIMTFEGNKIVVQGVSPGDSYWIGIGVVNGSTGYFDWRFNDGKYGQTTFEIDKNGNLKAHSIGTVVDYEYVAKKKTN